MEFSKNDLELKYIYEKINKMDSRNPISLELLSETLDLIEQNDYPSDKINELLKKFSSIQDIDEVLIIAIQNYLITKEVLRELVYKLNDVGTLISMLELAIKIVYHDNFGIVATNLIFAYDKYLDVVEINNLIFYAKDLYEKTMIPVVDTVIYLENLKGDKTYSKKPEWVSVLSGENLSLLNTINPGDSIDGVRENKFTEIVSESQNLFYSMTKNDDLIPDGIPINIEETIQSYLSTLSIDNSTVSHNPNRIFGPMNRFMSRDCPFNPESLGPCRMLECQCREINIPGIEYIEDINLADWFSGYCDKCLCKIRDKSHAIRYPVKGGGWRGTFCSIKCLQSGELMENTEEENIRIELLRKTLDSDGIMDRANT